MCPGNTFLNIPFWSTVWALFCVCYVLYYYLFVSYISTCTFYVIRHCHPHAQDCRNLKLSKDCTSNMKVQVQVLLFSLIGYEGNTVLTKLTLLTGGVSLFICH